MRRIEISQRRLRIGRGRTGQRVDESEGREKERRKSVRTRAEKKEEKGQK